MSVSVSMQRLAQVSVQEFSKAHDHDEFATLTLRCDDGQKVTVFTDAETAKAMAAAYRMVQLAKEHSERAVSASMARV